MKTWDETSEVTYWNVRFALHDDTVGAILSAAWQPILWQVRDQIKMGIIYELRGFGYDQ